METMRTAELKHWYAYAVVAAVSSLVTVAVTRGAPVAAESSTSARLQRLEDESAIRHLMIEYGHDLDTRDYVAYSKLFARDGVWAGGIGTGRGPDGVLAMLQRTVGPEHGSLLSSGHKHHDRFHRSGSCEGVLAMDRYGQEPG
jgi:SnoaL-like domain